MIRWIRTWRYARSARKAASASVEPRPLSHHRLSTPVRDSDMAISVIFYNMSPAAPTARATLYGNRPYPLLRASLTLNCHGSQAFLSDVDAWCTNHHEPSLHSILCCVRYPAPGSRVSTYPPLDAPAAYLGSPAPGSPSTGTPSAPICLGLSFELLPVAQPLVSASTHHRSPFAAPLVLAISHRARVVRTTSPLLSLFSTTLELAASLSTQEAPFCLFV